jgi:MinD-like ATPase involved in chromosome partitioning or flagellar assembly
MGRIITFYSYKGGAGRSLLLANVAWLLASNGRRVLVIDWDLEAPGLHRFFHPFLHDPELNNSDGVIDAIIAYAESAVAAASSQESPDWILDDSNLIRYAVSLEWEFQRGGFLDLIPAGRQDTAYAARVNWFDWATFYSRLGGGTFLEAVKRRLRQDYDYILIDSPSGVSYISGICTVQMPDEVVVCFTLNHQSVQGASEVARDILRQRSAYLGEPSIRIWPVPIRVETAELARRESARQAAQASFNPLLPSSEQQRPEAYWAAVEVPIFPYYAYEEVLAAFAERPGNAFSLLASVERLVTRLTEGAIEGMPIIPEQQRIAALQASGWSSRQPLPENESW